MSDTEGHEDENKSDNYMDVEEEDEDEPQNGHGEENDPESEDQNPPEIVNYYSQRVALLNHIQEVIALIHEMTRLTMLMYNEMRAEIIRIHRADNSEEHISDTVATNRQILTTLINLSRLFNPRILNEESSRIINYKDTWHPDMLIRLLLGLNNGIQYILNHGQELLEDLAPLLARLERDPLNEQVWSDVELFHNQLMAFVGQVLNPQIISTAHQMVNDDQ